MLLTQYFEAIAATTEEVLQGTPMSEAFVNSFNNHSDVIQLNFRSNKVVGHVQSAKVVDGKLYVNGIVDKSLLDIDAYYCVVSYKVVEGAHGKVCIPMAYGLTQSPIDTGVTKLKGKN
jgi:hypothetical protein